MRRKGGEVTALVAITLFTRRTVLVVTIVIMNMNVATNVAMNIAIIPVAITVINTRPINIIMIATTTTGISAITGSMTVGITINTIIVVVDTKNPAIASKGCPWVAFIISANMIRIR